MYCCLCKIQWILYSHTCTQQLLRCDWIYLICQTFSCWLQNNEPSLQLSQQEVYYACIIVKITDLLHMTYKYNLVKNIFFNNSEMPVSVLTTPTLAWFPMLLCLNNQSADGIGERRFATSLSVFTTGRWAITNTVVHMVVLGVIASLKVFAMSCKMEWLPETSIGPVRCEDYE